MIKNKIDPDKHIAVLSLHYVCARELQLTVNAKYAILTLSLHYAHARKLQLRERITSTRITMRGAYLHESIANAVNSDLSPL